MIELTGTLTAVSPLHIGMGKKSGTFAKTLEYIPGRTIRGMIGYYLYTNKRELFNKLRISEDMDMSNTGVYFKDALPRSGDQDTVASPVSLRWCKKCAHLMEHKATECHNVVDDEKCLHEGKKVAGFIILGSVNSGELKIAQVNTQISTKCPITRDGHTSPGSDNESSPYHIEGIVPGTKFRFKCLVEDEYVDDLKETLTEAGVFAGLGGYRSRGYGTVAFTNITETPVSEVIRKRSSEISGIRNVMMVTNSPMILRNDDMSVIGFGDRFEEYAAKTSVSGNSSGTCIIEQGEEDQVKQRLTEGIARGWSIKDGNKVSEIIPCIGHGSCVMVRGNPEVLAILEMYGVGEMTNSGYGDVYFMGGQI
ncbi:MAG: RAMP superfamily CRISPR-associated protein [Euryarchaeota archaeon]|nr:RAMP superfamily CRISPR-associated protein [Euryarchaeota archaeon]